jgi:hypothetical protein
MDTQKDIGFLRSSRTGWSAQNRHSPQTRDSAERGNMENAGFCGLQGSGYMWQEAAILLRYGKQKAN